MNATHALGWSLVHFLWQGTALALLLGIALALTRPAAARTRYALGMLTLVAMVVLPIATAVRLYQRASITAQDSPLDRSSATPSHTQLPALAVANTSGAAPAQTATAVAAPTLFTQVKNGLEPVVPWLVAAWVLGVLLLSVRLGHGWLAARRLRIEGTREATASLQQIVARLAARLRVTKPVQLLESVLVEVPAVIGCLRPVILVPSSALSGLTPQQLEVLLAHELAHIRRYDYVVNVAQCVIETLLFYHPAVWWVSRRVRDEREHCCDDVVVQVCGDPYLYASALVGMERLRPATPRLALAATGAGGSLLHRIKRLVLPAAARTDHFPRWAAGLAGAVAVTIALLATGSDRLAGEPSRPIISADTTRATPDTVLRHPDPSQPLAQRWEWARTQAKQFGKKGYWIGYTIPRATWLEHSVYVDRGMEVTGSGITISGRMFGNFQGFLFRGVRLAPLTGSDDSDDIAILFGFATDQSGRVVLTHVHVASFYLPMDFRGRTLLWLGRAADAQSLPLVDGLFASTAPQELREDVVSAIGIHGSSNLTVPILLRILGSREATDVRSQAAEWLGFHPTPAAVTALSNAARTDAAGDVRREAAEALSENLLPAAFDSTIAVAKTANDPDARRAAVEGIGRKDDDKALAALTTIAQSDRDEDVQRAAVETLGEMPSGRGLSVVQNIARSHPRSDVRRAAIETLGEKLAPAEAVTVLKDVASSDRDDDVRRAAVEALGEIGGTGLTVVIDIARGNSSSDVRRAAMETIGEKAPRAQALDLLTQVARRDRDSDVQRAAVEALGEMKDDRAYNVLIDLARTHPNSDVRRAAIETLGESGGGRTDSVIAIIDDVVQKAGDPDVASQGIETLGELNDPRALARVARIARGTGNVDLRRKAIETYAETAPTDSVLSLLKGILATDAPEDVTSKVLETLEELDDGAGIPMLIDAARSHPNREVRADALRRLAESDDPRVQQVFDQTLRRP